MRYRGLILLTLIVVALPWVLPNNYFLDIAVRIGINAIVVLGLNLLIGYAGQISLGHAAFLGIGAYASAVFPTHFGWHPILALIAGVLIAGGLAFLLSRPIFKLKGHYLAMATLGFGIIVNIALRNETQWTGGPDGMPVPTMRIGSFAIDKDIEWYGLVAAFLVFSVWACQNIIDSPFGRALRALHGSEVAAQVVGVNLSRYKMLIFVSSAMFASMMGSVTAHYIGYVSPHFADFFHSIELVTMVVVGGMASIYGSLVGALILTALPQALATFEGWETVVFGLILMIFMIFLPRGLVPTLSEKIPRWFGKKNQEGGSP